MNEPGSRPDKAPDELPFWAERLLLCLAPFRNRDTVVGDFAEIYQYIAAREGRRRALRWYGGQVLKSLPVFFSNSFYYGGDMLKHYLKIAVRHLRRQKGYAFINIVGLAIGLACFILIFLYVQYERSFDRFHENADRIHRIVQQRPGDVYLGTDHSAVTPAPLAQTLVSEFPEVTQATTIDQVSALLHYGDGHFYEDGLWADAHFFEVFPFPMIQGNPETALIHPNSIVLTASLVEKLFDDENPIGKTIMHENRDVYTVTGVIEDVPNNAHFTFAYVASILSEPIYVRKREEWNQRNWYTYFVLQEGVPHTRLQAKLPAFVQKYLADDTVDPRQQMQYYIQPLTSIHLHSHINAELSVNGDIKYLYFFSAIGLVILLMACINYMNLAIARSIKRAREVGLRKVVGARRAQLIMQFVGESVLLSYLALALALAVVHLVLPAFATMVERDLHIDYLGDGLLLPGLLAVALLVGITSGSYPAFFMASLRPVHVLKGLLRRSGRSGRSGLRRLLIVGQYTASIILMVGSLIIYQQLRFIQNKEIGYNREQVVVMPIKDREARKNYATIERKLFQNPNIISVTSSAQLPTLISNQTTVQGWQGSSESDALSIYSAPVGYGFLDVFEIELVEGRNFSRDFAQDPAGAYLLNETAVKALGWDAAIGKAFSHWYGDGPVVGVIKDFHMHSLHQSIEPLVLYLDPEFVLYIAARIRPEDIPDTIAFLERTVKAFTPYPFEYEFLDETFDRLYKTETKYSQIFGYFAGLALLIACLGLFGLAAFTAEQRTKEIGVRKVLGASVESIVLLLSKEFTTLVFLAFVLAVPIVYVAMNRWLEDFAYRIDMGPVVFLVTMVSVLLIAFLSVSYQAIKAARVNPITSLQHE